MPKYNGGLLSAPVNVAASAPYVEANSKNTYVHGLSKGQAQFGVSVGMPSDKEYHRLFEGEQYVPLSKTLSLQRLEGRALFLTPNGFKYSSRDKKTSSSGDYYGTISKKPFEHLPDGTYRARDYKPEKIEIPARAIYTRGSKKPAGLSTAFATTPKINFSEIEYGPSPYDAFDKDCRRRAQESRAATGDKLAFKVPAGKELAPVSKELDEPLPTGPLSTIKGATRRPATEEEARAFRPSSPPKSLSPLYGGFCQYPEHAPDPLDDKIVRSAKASMRALPMVKQLEGLSDSLRERVAFSPTHPAKSLYTKSPMLMKIKIDEK